MSIKELVSHWEASAQGALTDETYSVHLSRDDAARIDALVDMYPKRTKEQLVSELVSAALSELERSFPYIESNEIASIDEFGDPIYKDKGPTSEFQNLTRKYLARYKGAANA
jgi:hypothetical protein